MITKTWGKKILAKWVKLLKLSPPKWDKITFSFGAEDESEDVPIGFCKWFYEFQTAEVFLMTPRVYEERYGEELTNEIAEKVIIHELLHVVLQAGGTGNQYDQHLEQGLNVLAEILWRVYGEE